MYDYHIQYITIIYIMYHIRISFISLKVSQLLYSFCNFKISFFLSSLLPFFPSLSLSPLYDILSVCFCHKLFIPPVFSYEYIFWRSASDQTVPHVPDPPSMWGLGCACVGSGIALSLGWVMSLQPASPFKGRCGPASRIPTTLWMTHPVVGLPLAWINELKVLLLNHHIRQAWLNAKIDQNRSPSSVFKYKWIKINKSKPPPIPKLHCSMPSRGMIILS